MIQITPTIAIDENEIQEDFVRSSGPGGQNVNKVSSAVQLRFNINSPSIPDEVRQKIIKLAGNRINESGVLIIDSRRFRSQPANRQAAIERLCDLIRESSQKPEIRHKTRPTRSSKERRLESKHQRSTTKNLRRQKPEISD
jgi:ribosome-associated protein